MTASVGVFGATGQVGTVMRPLAALHQRFGLRRLVASTYQAVSGAGGSGVDELAEQVKAAGDKAPELAFDGSAVSFPAASVFPATIAFNVHSVAGTLVDDG